MPLSEMEGMPRSVGIVDASILDASSPTETTSSVSLDMDLLESSTNCAHDVNASKRSCSRCDSKIDTPHERNEYDVTLEKDLYGLGIYFAKQSDSAIVDLHVPFYKLPSGQSAPGEACGMITPGDVLLRINEEDITSYKFEEVVEALRNLSSGHVVLRFRSPEPPPLDTEGRAVDETLEQRIWDLEKDLERERKCRQIAEKKMHMYREEVLRLTNVNTVLQCNIKSLENDLRAAQKFARYAHVAV